MTKSLNDVYCFVFIVEVNGIDMGKGWNGQNQYFLLQKAIALNDSFQYLKIKKYMNFFMLFLSRYYHCKWPLVSLNQYAEFSHGTYF